MQNVDGPHTQKPSKPWRIAGPLEGPAASAGLEQACKALHVAARRQPTEDDAAREALRLTGAKKAKKAKP